MTSLVSQAVEHWPYVAPLLKRPRDDADYGALVQSLDELLVMVGDDDNHPLASLLMRLADLVEHYDQTQRPRPHASGDEVSR